MPPISWNDPQLVTVRVEPVRLSADAVVEILKHLSRQWAIDIICEVLCSFPKEDQAQVKRFLEES